MNEDTELSQEELKRSKKENFVFYCDQGFDLLQQAALAGTDLKSIKDSNFALRRMLGFFVDQEEFEKCAFLKMMLEKHFPGNTEPIFDYRKI
jgi:hypothetical protein